MGIWRDRVVPRAADFALDNREIRRFREEVVAGTSGEVVEVGFGSGLNLALYPPAVTKVLAVEPSAVATRLAAKRIGSARVPVEVVGLDAQQLPLETASADAAVSTFTLCTIPDPRRALEELLRVLRPGGTFHFLEHGLSPVPAVARWQRRLNPLQRRLAAGCHLDRQIDRIVEEAGFVLDEVRNDEMTGPLPLRPFGYLYIGTATKPGGAGRSIERRASHPETATSSPS